MSQLSWAQDFTTFLSILSVLMTFKRLISILGFKKPKKRTWFSASLSSFQAPCWWLQELIGVWWNTNCECTLVKHLSTQLDTKLTGCNRSILNLMLVGTLTIELVFSVSNDSYTIYLELCFCKHNLVCVPCLQYKPLALSNDGDMDKKPFW